jgi:hypothetical protein
LENVIVEIDITDFFDQCAPMDYSASVAEIGQNAGPDTWRAACDDAPEWNLLNTEEKRDAWREFVRTRPMRGDHCVSFPSLGRSRWGTMSELRADIDHFLDCGALPRVKGVSYA